MTGPLQTTDRRRILDIPAAAHSNAFKLKCLVLEAGVNNLFGVNPPVCLTCTLNDHEAGTIDFRPAERRFSFRATVRCVDRCQRERVGSRCRARPGSHRALHRRSTAIIVPMGLVRGLPVGLSLVGTAWSEPELIAYAYAFEQATHARRHSFR